MTKPADLLRLVDVSKTYVMGEVKVPVLHDVNMAVPRGDVLVIVGPSGSGKSTLLNLIGGLDTPTSGSVFFNDRDIAKSSERELTAYRRENVGFVFQFYNLVPTLTAEENVTVTTELCRDPVKPAEALRLVGLEQRADHFPAQLSGGEQQRTAIARAVAKRPQLLLCDEPTGALDLDTGRKVLKAIANLNTELGMTVIIITHNSAIAGMAHHTVRLGSGTIAESQTNEHPIDPLEIVW
jgi:putative ABC transport system ATP-binding protein